jgi:hypothetical protein
VSPIAIAAVPNLPPLTPYPTVTASVRIPVTPSATATATMPRCAGDCDGSGTVAVNEILIMVNIALGSAEMAACPGADGNQDGHITVNEIIAAVHNALDDCGRVPTPTATLTFGGCSEVCDGSTCLLPLIGSFGTCSGAGEEGCECVPFSAEATPTPG